MTSSSWRRAGAALGIAGMAFAGGLMLHEPADTVAQSPAFVAPAKPTITPAERREATAHAQSLSKAFRYAAEKATPSVVKIHAITKSKLVRNNVGELGQRGENPFKGTPFEDMFPEMQRGGGAQEARAAKDGVGSGVIISTDGIVLTNNHVVADADEVTVSLADGREFVATDIKTDPDSDLAVLRLKDAKDLVAAPIGDSDQLEIGDWVIAIGNPFELESTVSAGIISGKGRELGMIRRAKFLQTDAAINPGNSGGPLLNLDGEIVGINTAIASNTGSFNGIGFAIPANHAKWIASQLTGKGTVERGYLGVGVSQLTPDLARKWNLKPNTGVVVGEVMPDSPAANAGIQEGDVIMAVNGHAVATPRDLQEQVERLPFDAKQSVAVMRDGKAMSIGTMIKALPQQTAQVRPVNGRSQKSVRESAVEAKGFGFQVSSPSSAEKKLLNGADGVLVVQVEDDGPAAAKGLEAGMMIRKVGNTTVSTVAEFEAALSKETSPDGVVFQVRSPAGGSRFVVIKPTA